MASGTLTDVPEAASLLTLGERLLEWLRRKAPRAEAEIFLGRSRSRGLELQEGALETVQDSVDEGAGLRVILDGRMGFTFHVGLAPEALEAGIAQLLAHLPHLPPDEHRVLPDPEKPGVRDGLEAGLFDSSLFRDPLTALVPRLRELEAEMLRSDKRVKRALRSGYGESRGEVAVLNTRGVRAFERGTHCGISASATAEAGGEVQVAYGSASARSYGALDFSRVARETAFRVGSLVGSRKLPTGRRAVLFDPWVSGEILEMLAGLMSADEVQRGKSLLKGKKGRKIANPLVEIVDDPLRPAGLGSALYDAEGVPTRRKTMVEAGVLKDYFYDSYTAHKDGVRSNGSAGRASFKSLPAPSCSNFFMSPGSLRRDQLIADTKDGILVLDIMGMHMADPISGEFSVGVSGVAIRDGELAGGVRSAMVAGNILDLLGRVDAVADDLVFYGSLASPTFRVVDLSVA